MFGFSLRNFFGELFGKIFRIRNRPSSEKGPCDEVDLNARRLPEGIVKRKLIDHNSCHCDEKGAFTLIEQKLFCHFCGKRGEHFTKDCTAKDPEYFRKNIPDFVTLVYKPKPSFSINNIVD